MGSGVDGAVQATAFLAAACRAAELGAHRPRLRDPYADRFVAARPDHRPGYRGLRDAGGDEVVARTVLVDQLLAAELAAPPAPTVVNLGAGFCARPYRLDMSGCRRVVELDDAELLAVKQQVLAGEPPSAPVRRVPLDLRDRAGLAGCLAAECADAARVVLVSEGLLPYLPPAQVSGLAAVLAAALPGARWLTDLVSQTSARQMATLARSVGAPVRLYGLADLGPFTGAGWEVTDYRILPVARRGPLGRPGPAAGPAPRRSHEVVNGVVALRHAGPAGAPAG